MNLVSTAEAIYQIKEAQPGATLYFGLYKNAENEKEYSDLANLLECSSIDKILDGVYKVYSEPDTTNTFATGWINAKVWEHYYNNLAQSMDVIPSINGFTIWPDAYGSLDEYITAINDNNNMQVNASYDAASDRIILTAKTPGKGGVVSLKVEEIDEGWPAEYGEIVSPGGYLTGDFHEAQNGIHVWIKNTPFNNEKNEEEEGTDDKDYDIRLCVKPGYVYEEHAYPMVIDLTERWSWDEYTEPSSISSIDWGDGTPIEIIDSLERMVHEYQESGEYNILIKNIHFCGWSGKGAPAQWAMPVKEIEFKTAQVITKPNNSFRSLEILERIIGTIYTSHSYRSSGGHTYMFLYCNELYDLSKLTIHFGPGVDGNGITAFNSIFWGCKKITNNALHQLTIEHFNKENIISATSIFNGANLTSIDNPFFGSNLKYANYAFSGNKNLRHLNANILDNLEDGAHMFEDTDIKSADKSFGLPSLINGDCMFFNTKMPYKLIEQIYESLTAAPENADYGSGSNNEPERYAITFGYDRDEKNIIDKLSTLLNIDKTQYEDVGGLPSWIHGQYNNQNAKRWYISFT